MSSRNSIACERCRRLRKRCNPPAPCASCLKAEEVCIVRGKARPGRKHESAPQQQRATRRQGSPLHRRRSHRRSISRNSEASRQTQQASAPAGCPARGYDAVLNGFQSMISTHLETHFGYVLRCDLSEPLQVSWPVSSGNSLGPHNDERIQCVHLQDGLVTLLLSTFRKLMPFHQPILPDDHHWLELTHQITDSAPAEQDVRTIILDRAESLPIDQIALLFSCLALASLWQCNIGLGQAFFDQSTALVDEFPGDATYHLCFAAHLQHSFVLHMGTSNRSRAIAALAVQMAQDLGLNKKNKDPKMINLNMLRLYLFIMFCDQYSAQTHGTKPALSNSDIDKGIFDPLTHMHPELEALVQIIKTNGRIMEILAKRSGSVNESESAELESLIKNVSSSRQTPLPGHNTEGINEILEPLVMLHVFWYRIILQLPSLGDKSDWISSVSICLHSARAIISLYFEMRLPHLKVLAAGSANRSSRPLPCALPPTWRQAKRIMIASFIVFWSYWNGELTRSEAMRLICMALLLMEHQKARYSKAAESSIRTLNELSALSKFDVSSRMQAMLISCTEQEPSNVLLPTTQHSQADQEFPVLACDGFGQDDASAELQFGSWGDETGLTNLFPTTNSMDFPFLSPSSTTITDLGLLGVL